MSNKIAFFLPTRSGSQRVVEKNTRNFAETKGGLTKIKLLQLIKTKNVDEIILSTNNDECISIAENLLSSVGISAYIILVALMVMCNSHNEMRVVLLLMVLFFIGCLSGFMLALHLLDISIILKSGK